MSEGRLFTIEEAARRLGLSQGSVYDLIRDGRLTRTPSSKRRVMVSEETLATYEAARAQAQHDRQARLARAPGTFAFNLRKLRHTRKLSLRALGRLCGISAQALSQYELGDSKARQETLERLAQALGVECSELQDDREAPHQKPLPKLWPGRQPKLRSTPQQHPAGILAVPRPPGRPCNVPAGPERRQRIQALRDQGLTIRQIARELGITIPTVAGDLRLSREEAKDFTAEKTKRKSTRKKKGG